MQFMVPTPRRGPTTSQPLEDAVSKLLFIAAIGVGLAVIAVGATGWRRIAGGEHGDDAEPHPAPERPWEPAGARGRRVSKVALAQFLSGFGGLLLGWHTTGLLGMAVLLGGLGALLPPFMAAPRRRREQSKLARAWQLWTRQLAELARAGAGLNDAIAASVPHAPPELRPTLEVVAARSRVDGIDAALEELGAAGHVWEPEVAAGLRMAATTGGSVASPLLDLSARIGDIVELHNRKTESVAQLWTQTITLLSLAAGLIILMYHNNPAYFEPYRAGPGQLVLVGISGLLLMATTFLVHHSVVRERRSVLSPPTRRDTMKDPL